MPALLRVTAAALALAGCSGSQPRSARPQPAAPRAVTPPSSIATPDAPASIHAAPDAPAVPLRVIAPIAEEWAVRSADGDPCASSHCGVEIHRVAIGPGGAVAFGGNFHGVQRFAGTRLAARSYRDALAGVLDARGAPRWLRAFPGRYIDSVEAIAFAPDGDVVVAGRHDGSIALPGVPAARGAPVSTVFVARLAGADGRTRWATGLQLLAPTPERRTDSVDASLGSLVLTPAGDACVGGSVDGAATLGGARFGTESTAGFVVCLAGATGRAVWHRVYPDNVLQLARGADGGLVVMTDDFSERGARRGPAAPRRSVQHATLHMLDARGEERAARRLEAEGFMSVFWDLATNAAGVAFVTASHVGRLEDRHFHFDREARGGTFDPGAVAVVRIDPDGSLRWITSVPDDAHRNRAWTPQVDASGRLFMKVFPGEQGTIAGAPVTAGSRTHSEAALLALAPETGAPALAVALPPELSVNDYAWDGDALVIATAESSAIRRVRYPAAAE